MLDLFSFKKFIMANPIAEKKILTINLA